MTELPPEASPELFAEARRFLYGLQAYQAENRETMIPVLSQLVDECVTEGDHAGVWANVNALTDLERLGTLTPMVLDQYESWLSSQLGFYLAIERSDGES